MVTELAIKRAWRKFLRIDRERIRQHNEPMLVDAACKAYSHYRVLLQAWENAGSPNPSWWVETAAR